MIKEKKTFFSLCKKYVAAFVVSSIASTVDRFSKPFNPLLGETYEFARLVIFYLYNPPY